MKAKKYISYIILAVLIVLQLTNIIYCFTVKKEGVHSDEIYSYATANSPYMPFLSIDGRNDKTIKHNDEWYSGEVFTNYLSVEENQRFYYTPILKNEKDIHTPLYFMVLHTVCSFFPNQFSWWYGFSINIVLFILTQIGLFLFVRNVTENDYIALITCVLYGFSQGGINTFIYIRMYAMVTCFAIYSMYVHSLLYRKPEKFKVYIPVLMLITFLGGLTHMYFLIFAGSVSAVYCVYYLINKKIKRLLAYAVSQLSAVGMFLAVHPYVLAEFLDVNSRRDAKSVYGGFWFEFRNLKSFMVNELFGLHTSYFPSYFGIHLIEVIIVLSLIIIPVCFLLRKEMWWKKICNKIWRIITDLVVSICRMLSLEAVSIVCGICMLVLIISFTATVFMCGDTSTRYVFILYPFIYFIIILLLYRIICGIHIGKNEGYKNAAAYIIMFVGAACLIINIYFNSPKCFYFIKNNTTVELDDLPRNADYIIALYDYAMFDCFAEPLRNVDNFFAAYPKNLLYEGDKLSNHKDNDIYFIIQNPRAREFYDEDETNIKYDEEFVENIMNSYDVDNEVVKKYISKYESIFIEKEMCKDMDYLGISEVFGRTFYVFHLE